MEIRVNLSDEHVQALSYLAAGLGTDLSGALEKAATPDPDAIGPESSPSAIII